MAYSYSPVGKSLEEPTSFANHFGKYYGNDPDLPASAWSPLMEGLYKFVSLEDPNKPPDYSTNEDPNKVANRTVKPTRPILRRRNELSDHPNVATMEKIALASDRKQLEILLDLQDFSVKTNLAVVQENGQRSAGPPKDYDGPPPPKGSEIFIGRLPRHLYERQVYELFSRIGRVYQIRMMMDFAGTNRGFCFLQYFNSEDARKAIQTLDDWEMIPRWRIGVLKSVNNCRLVIEGVQKNKSRSQILREMQKKTEGASDVILHEPLDKDTKNRGYAYVEYASHKLAAMARRRLIPGKVTVFGQDVRVDWAEPEPERPTLMARNLPLDITDAELHSIFSFYSSNGVTNMKRRGWNMEMAFIDFQSKNQADAARLGLDKKELKGSFVEVKWAKPRHDDCNQYAYTRKVTRNANSFMQNKDQMWRSPPSQSRLPPSSPNMHSRQPLQPRQHFNYGRQQQGQPLSPSFPNMLSGQPLQLQQHFNYGRQQQGHPLSPPSSNTHSGQALQLQQHFNYGRQQQGHPLSPPSSNTPSGQPLQLQQHFNYGRQQQGQPLPPRPPMRSQWNPNPMDRNCFSP